MILESQNSGYLLDTVYENCMKKRRCLSNVGKEVNTGINLAENTLAEMRDAYKSLRRAIGDEASLLVVGWFLHELWSLCHLKL